MSLKKTKWSVLLLVLTFAQNSFACDGAGASSDSSFFSASSECIALAKSYSPGGTISGDLSVRLKAQDPYCGVIFLDQLYHFPTQENLSLWYQHKKWLKHVPNARFLLLQENLGRDILSFYPDFLIANCCDSGFAASDGDCPDVRLWGLDALRDNTAKLRLIAQYGSDQKTAFSATDFLFEKKEWARLQVVSSYAKDGRVKTYAQDALRSAKQKTSVDFSQINLEKIPTSDVITHQFLAELHPDETVAKDSARHLVDSLSTFFQDMKIHPAWGLLRTLSVYSIHESVAKDAAYALVKAWKNGAPIFEQMIWATVMSKYSSVRDVFWQKAILESIRQLQKESSFSRDDL